MYYIFFALLPIILYYLKKYINGGVNNKTHDLTGKFIIITGASSGIGKVSALHLINSNAKVIFACRNEERAKKINGRNSYKFKKKCRLFKFRFM